jgi:L-lactate dehydrogenase (cytochrome)
MVDYVGGGCNAAGMSSPGFWETFPREFHVCFVSQPDEGHERDQGNMKLKDCINLQHLQRMAKQRLPTPIFDFLEGGADDEWTLGQNPEAFNHYPLTTRTLVDISSINTATRILGQDIAWPVIVAPTGASELFHRDAESAVARAAAESATLYTLSTMSNTSLEQVAAASSAARAFQLYVFRDRQRVESLVDRCRNAGYQSLVLTVDTPLSGNRERDRVNGMSIPPRWNLRNLAKFARKPEWSLNAAFRCKYDLANFSDVGAGETRGLALDYINRQFDRSVTWEQAEWLARLWNGPFAIKGILSAADARRAADIGATAIWISNHGGRQLDGVAATVDCLPGIRKAVGVDIEIILDGGVRRGTHVLKALALGANACALGRPCLYGLAAAGQAGVTHSLSILRAELERAMALAGCRNIADINADVLHQPIIY